MHWGKKLSPEVSLKLNFVAYFFPSKFDQRVYRRSAIYYYIWINKWNTYRFFSLRALRVLLKYTVKVLNHFTGFSARNGELYLKYNLSIPKFPVFFFFLFSYIISKTNDRNEKNYLQNMSILTNSIQKYF